MLNRAICAARVAWYGVSEPRQLVRNRKQYKYGHSPQEWECGWNHGSPLVSVLIPTHNRAELLLTRALPSVLAQTYTNLEIIVAIHGDAKPTRSAIFQHVVKGGKRVCWLNDKTGRVTVMDAAGKTVEDRIVLLEVPRRRTYPPTAENHWLAGPVAPLNAALEAAQGAWIARIDDDDIWTPDHIERLLRAAQAHDWEFVSSAYERERGGVRETVDHDGGNPPIGGTQTWLWRSYLRFMCWNPDCWRKTWNRPNDLDLADRFRKAGVRIGWIPDRTALILPRPGETTVGLAAYRRDTKATEAAFAFRS